MNGFVPWTQTWEQSLTHNYGTPGVELVRGAGARVWDDQGREYIDLLAGIAVNALGHAHPELVANVSAQIGTLGHTSNLVATGPVMSLAKQLVELSGSGRSGRVFFCNSGDEANEAAFKLTRLTGRTNVVVARGGFHGRTMGALALTAQPAKQDPFRPLPGNVTVVEFGSIDELSKAVDHTTAAVFLEPIQGENGVIVAPSGYLPAARAITEQHQALLVIDEVQTGIGRTGAWFGFQHEGIEPDVVTMAKGLGGGLPIGAMVAFGHAAELFQPGMHGSTFGGNPVCAVAALTVLEVIERNDLLSRARTAGEVLSHGLVERSQGLVCSVRGRGLLLAAQLRHPVAADLERACRANGLLVNNVTVDAIRLAPPLVLTDQDISDALIRWEQACSTIGIRP